MPKMPVISAEDLINFLIRFGFEIKSQKGSHIKLVKLSASGKQTVIIPNHRIIKKGTLRNILRYLEFSTEDFIKLYR